MLLVYASVVRRTGVWALSSSRGSRSESNSKPTLVGLPHRQDEGETV